MWGLVPSGNAPSQVVRNRDELGPGCRGGHGSPHYPEMLPEAGIDGSSYTRNQRISGPALSPIQYLSGLHHRQIGQELQEHTEIHPCLLGLGADAFLLVYCIPRVFRDGELDSLANHKWPPKESRNFQDGGMAQFQEFGSPVNEGQHFNGGTLGPSPKESQGVDLQLVFRQINLMVSFFQVHHRILYHLPVFLIMFLTG